MLDTASLIASNPVGLVPVGTFEVCCTGLLTVVEATLAGVGATVKGLTVGWLTVVAATLVGVAATVNGLTVFAATGAAALATGAAALATGAGEAA